MSGPVRTIQEYISRHYGVPVEQLAGASREQAIVLPRHVAIYLTTRLCPLYSTPQIGRIFGGRDHTTVIHARNKIAAAMRASPALRAAIEQLESELRPLLGAGDAQPTAPPVVPRALADEYERLAAIIAEAQRQGQILHRFIARARAATREPASACARELAERVAKRPPL